MLQRCVSLSIFALFCLLNCTNKSQSSPIASKEAENENLKIILKDDFENGMQSFWTYEATDSTRYKIVKDPLTQKNKVLQVNLKLDDYNSGGRRTEFPIFTKDSLGYKTNYSFRFMLPEDFFRKDEKPGFIIIHQWHDAPDPGFDWSTQNKVTHPPVYLFVDRKEGGIYDLIFKTGLESGKMNETVTSTWKEHLQPNRWYTFSCEVFWHIYSGQAYALPMLDGQFFYSETKSNNEITHKISRGNMYNRFPNYPKIGLYRFGNELYDRTIYFDDFNYESQKVDNCK